MPMRILSVFGTRPEAIKFAPLLKELGKRGEFVSGACITAQHRQMLDQALHFFDISPDFDLDIMRHNQTLFDITAIGLKGMESVLDSFKPDMVLVQGDTTTAFIGALAAFYNKIPVGHIEAGLRSFDKYSPFPEEVNRSLVGRIADIHFAPTHKAKENLIAENISDKNVHVVGNTVIDALFLCLDIIKQNDLIYADHFRNIDFGKRVILVTGHRRESFGEPFENICRALSAIAGKEDVEIVYPVHLNPNVRKPVFDILSGMKNIHLIEPLDYPYLVWLLNKSHLVLTDSGGIQEEAPSLGKPVLVLRDVTERTEGIDAGTARLVGTEFDNIVNSALELLNNPAEYEKMSKAQNPYGDGHTSPRILDILKSMG